MRKKLGGLPFDVQEQDGGGLRAELLAPRRLRGMPLFAANLDELETKALDFARGVGPEPANELPWGIQAIDDSAARKAAKEEFLKNRVT